MTMSISSAPASTAARVSASLMSRNVWPHGNPVATLRDLDAAALERVLGLGDHRRVDAHRRHVRDRRVAGLRAHRLDAQRPDLARRVLPLERGEIHHPDRQVERPQLRCLLDRAALQRIDPRVDPDLVDGGDPSEQAAEGVAERARPGRPSARMSSSARSRASAVGTLVAVMGRGYRYRREAPRPETGRRAPSVRAQMMASAPRCRVGALEEGSRMDRRRRLSRGSRHGAGSRTRARARCWPRTGRCRSRTSPSRPPSITVNVGDRVTWTNHDTHGPHGHLGECLEHGRHRAGFVEVDHVQPGRHVRLHLCHPPDDDRPVVVRAAAAGGAPPPTDTAAGLDDGRDRLVAGTLGAARIAMVVGTLVADRRFRRDRLKG